MGSVVPVMSLSNGDLFYTTSPLVLRNTNEEGRLRSIQPSTLIILTKLNDIRKIQENTKMSSNHSIDQSHHFPRSQDLF